MSVIQEERAIEPVLGSTRSLAPRVNLKLVRTLAAHKGSVTQTISLNSGHLVSSAKDGTVIVWDPQTGKIVFEMKGESCVSCLGQIPGGYLATGSHDQTIKIWDLKTGHLSNVLGPHISSGKVQVLKVLKSGNVLSYASDNSIKIWDPYLNIGNEPLLGIYRCGPKGEPVLIELASNDYVVSCSTEASFENVIRIWDPILGSLVRSYPAGGQNARALAILSDSLVAIGFADGSISCINLEELNLSQKLTDDNSRGAVTCLIPLPKGLLLSANENGLLQIWNPFSGRLIDAFPTGHKGKITSLVASKDGKQLITSSEDKLIKIWSLEDF